MTDQKAYWDNQFSKYSHVWGETPSKTAGIALALFRQHEISKILVPGSGYGRNSKVFSTAGFNVTGIEISEEACALAPEYDPATKVCNGSFLDDNPVEGPFEGIYCFNVLQLFLQPDRTRFVRKSAGLLSPGGLLFFTGISDQDPSCGQGAEVEDNTFAVQPDKTLHYFTVDDLRAHFEGYNILEVGELEDQVCHSLHGVKRYQIRYLAASV